MIEETMIHPETGEILYRDVRPIEYTYKGESIIVDQPGWYPADKSRNEDGILSQEDMKISGAAVRTMKARHAEKFQENHFEFGNTALA